MKRQIAFILSMLMMAGTMMPHPIEACRIEEGNAIVKYLGNVPPRLHRSDIHLEKAYTFEKAGEGKYTLAHYTSEHLATPELVKVLEETSGVVYAEANGSCRIWALPNDPYVSSQWYLNNESLAYERSSKVDIGAESLWIKGDNLEENVVAVIDTGVDYTHPDLADNIWNNTTTLPGKHGYNFMDQNDDPMDKIGHGTHCAGIIAAQADNAIGIAGVSRKTKIMALKYMDETGTGMMSQAIAAYEYVLEAKKQGVNIVAISNSWGNTENPRALEDIIASAGEQGIISVCAAGNIGTDLDVEKTFPAAYSSPYTIVVAASTPDDQLASFSCYGKYTADVAAPGTSMLSTYHREAYVPTLSAVNKVLLNFEDNNIGFMGSNISITNQAAFEGTHSLLWELTATSKDEIYLEGNTDRKYANEIVLEIPEAEEGLYLGLNFWGQCPRKEQGNQPTCHIEGFENNRWVNIGQLDIESINFWNSKFFAVNPGTTKLRFICTGIGEGSSLYLDDVGIGRTTGKYFYLQGTSAAAPMVAGEVAMLTRLFPNEDIVKIRDRVVGGVERSMKDLVVSDGRIDMKRAMEEPYAVMNRLIQGDNGNIKIIGCFFGINPGSLSLNGEKLEVMAWTDTEITAKYMGDFDGYGRFALTRRDGQVSSQLLLINNRAYNWNGHLAMPVALKDAAVAVWEDNIYVLGGTTEDNQPSQAVLTYNVKQNSWRRLQDLPDLENLQSYAYGATATALKDKILLMTFDEMNEKNDYYIYSIKEDAWEKKVYEAVPEPREYAKLITYDNEIYMIGGLPKGNYTGQEALSRDIWRLNKDKSWEKTATLIQGRYNPIAAVVKDRIIITGGNAGNGEYAINTEIYNGKEIEAGANLPLIGVNSSNSVYGGGEKLYIMTDGISFEDSGVIYSPMTNTWETSSYRLCYSQIEGIGSAVVYNQLYGIGGSADYRAVSSLESIPIEGSAAAKVESGMKVPLVIGAAVIVAILVLIILAAAWIKRKRKPKKIYIRK